EGFDPSQMQGGFTGEMPEGFDPSQIPGGFPGQSYGGTETAPSGDSGTPGNAGSSENGDRPSGGNIQMPGGDFNTNGMSNAASNSSGWIWLAVSVLILGAGLIIAKLYKH
ncbi:MAG: hypothetical protein ACI4P4_12665, partial [Faecousia sp.]